MELQYEDTSASNNEIYDIDKNGHDRENEWHNAEDYKAFWMKTLGFFICLFECLILFKYLLWVLQIFTHVVLLVREFCNFAVLK